ncbi:TPA: GNAT family N-acetyltransferase [Pseudomonas aeruginosa]|nr:GNAT family N-acetyltransferase [Pseudomonas aeruginosa]HBO2972839.1 GNAT family N-acetyltransferase [Pseudomonas aeruginosa]HCF1085321.1 GNAT family N-acetyltransferase [Pseudomonas aeruginosa]HCF1085627.1 GNAT family N-acetyltransferase [Pseudomonas aeruginosa]
MLYLIHPVSSSDSLDWLCLRNQLWKGHDHAEEISEFFNGKLVEPDEVLIARDDTGAAVAHIELSIRKDIVGLEGVRTGYIEGLFVDEFHRSSGIALQLLRASERWALNQGCHAFASDREDRVIVHKRFPGTPPSNIPVDRTACGVRLPSR